MLALEAPQPAAAKPDPSLPDAAALAAAAKPKRRIPCLRNRRIYEQVVLRKRPQSDVAKEFKISQQRVSQIVDQFHAWLNENLPPGTEEDSAQDQLTLAASHAYLRQEHLFGEAMRRLDQSGKERVVLKTRYSKSGEELGTHTARYPGSPNSGFMNAALKATMQQWKLAQMAMGLLGRAMEIQFWLPHEYDDEGLCRAEPAEEAQQVCAKSCDLPPASHKGQAPKVLWAADEPVAAEAPAAGPAAVSTPTSATACDRGPQSIRSSQGSASGCAKSCEAPEDVTPALISDDEWAQMVSAATDRRAIKKARHRQLARWKARRVG
jgi:hypothetical protein